MIVTGVRIYPRYPDPVVPYEPHTIRFGVDPWALYAVWLTGPGLWSGTVRSLDRVQYDGEMLPARFSHVEFLFQFGPQELWVYESFPGVGVRVTPWENVAGAIADGRVTDWYIHRMDVSMAQIKMIWLDCKGRWGCGYDYWKILLLYAWIRRGGRRQKIVPWWIATALNDIYVCSELTCEAGLGGNLDLCGIWSTRATTTPESQIVQVVGLPSARIAGHGDVVA